MNIPQYFLDNQVFDARPLGFNRQLIPNMINGGKHGDHNVGYKVYPDGKVWVSLYGPTAKEVTAGYECGMSIAKFNDLKEGDVFECFVMEEVKR